MSALSAIFGVDRDYVSSWIDRFDKGKIEALEVADGSGGPPSLDG